jgi:hypothetical protein
MVYLSFLHYTSLCISCDKNLKEFLMFCFVLWGSCFSFLSIKFYVCTWVNLLFVNIWHQFTCPKANWTPFKSCKINPSWSTLTWVTFSIYLSSKVEDMNAILLLPIDLLEEVPFEGKKKSFRYFFIYMKIWTFQCDSN